MIEKRLQDRQQWSIGDACSMSKVLELLSTKTAFQVIRELFFGTTRFEDFVERIGTSARQCAERSSSSRRHRSLLAPVIRSRGGGPRRTD